jgi:hypothetical protein
MPRGEHPNSLKNLKTIKTSEEASKLGKKGIKVTNEKRHKRKQARECMEIILSGKVTGKNAKEALKNIGFENEDQQNIALLMMSLFQKGVTTGDANIIKSILEISGDINQQEDTQSPQININIAPATKEDAEAE